MKTLSNDMLRAAAGGDLTPENFACLDGSPKISSSAPPGFTVPSGTTLLFPKTQTPSSTPLVQTRTLP